MSNQAGLSETDCTIIPMTAGVMLDTGLVRDPEALDLALVLDLYNRHGAVLISGLEMDRQRFVDLTDRICGGFMAYVGGADNDRSSAFGQMPTVLTTTGGAVEHKGIALHGEMFYSGQRPATLFFHCVRPSEDRGQTTLCDGVKLWQALPPRIRRRCEEQKLLYRRRYDREAWQRVYQTDDPVALRRLCEQSGVGLVMLEDGGIETRFTTPAYVDGPAGRAFVNSMLVWLTRELRSGLGDSLVRFEDGSEIPRKMIRAVHRRSKELTQDVDWLAGDVAIVNNMRVMHGRRGYDDPARDIIMRLSEEPLEAG